MNKAVFMDRDGTIIEDIGYLNHPGAIQFIPGSIDAIKKLNASGYKVIVITNQAGVARGLVSENMLQTIDKTLHKWLLSSGAHLDGIYYCPHHPEHGYYPYKQICECRKPHPGLIKKAQRDFNIDLAQSYMVGDKATDIEAGQKAGVKTIHVLSGRGKDEKDKIKIAPDHTAQNLTDAVNWIIK
jgi:D-glycero-D-manno-heptose 1,7-bisphosphate phosphatase